MAFVGGWIIALVAWVVTASHWTRQSLDHRTTSHGVVPDSDLGLGHFSHCIATSDEILSAVVHGDLPAAIYFHWLLLATLGNIVGGVVIVSLLNYDQVRN